MVDELTPTGFSFLDSKLSMGDPDGIDERLASGSGFSVSVPVVPGN